MDVIRSRKKESSSPHSQHYQQEVSKVAIQYSSFITGQWNTSYYTSLEIYHQMFQERRFYMEKEDVERI